ncbi:hypothetical protein MMC19_006258 [Ptychographa xylographoides]|nr:hypothetical protein [Ptychographa xylographoides]
MVAVAGRESPPDSKSRASTGRIAASLPVPTRAGNPLYSSPRPTGTPPSQIPSSASREANYITHGTHQARPKEGIATPVKAFLSSNVTPRSSSRKARVNSISSTPSTTPHRTPTSSRPTSTINGNEKFLDRSLGSNGLGLAVQYVSRSDQAGELLSPNGSDSATSLNEAWGIPEKPPARSETLPMFFHASDVKPSFSGKRNSRVLYSSAKARSNVSASYEDDATLDGSTSNAMSSTEDSQPRFFYANGVSEAEKPALKTKSSPASAVSSRHSTKRTPFPAQSQNFPPRASSPLKENGVSRKPSITKASPRAHIPLAYNGVQMQEQTHSRTPSQGQLDIGRRSSLKAAAATGQKPRHSKAGSISSLDSKSHRRSSLTISEAQAPSTISVSVPIFSVPKAVGTYGEARGKDDELTSITPSPTLRLSPQSQSTVSVPETPQSPTRILPVESKIDQLNSLAANARRERKVLDLEISNSSLLAINRTLEREMRKQTAELRRYRRLTSAGRLSNAPSARSRPSGSSTLAETDLGSDSDTENLLGDDLDMFESDDNLSSLSTSSPSPTSLARKSMLRRGRDESRLQLDLFKHQELLLESQRMNQSLKRCLNWTDDLITEGKKALAYHPRVDDRDVRGKVLTPDEVDGEFIRSTGLLSPAIDIVEDPWDRLGNRTSDREDIDLDLESV